MNRRPKLLFYILIVCILVLQSGVFVNGMEGGLKDQPIIIGHHISVTGPYSGFIEYQRQGTELAVEEINEAGGVNGRKIQLITEDTASAVAPAIASFKKLLNDNPEMVAIIGEGVSSIVGPLQPYIKEAKIVYTSQAVSSEVNKHGENPYFFRVRANDTIQAKVITKFVVEDLGQQNIAILYCTDEYGAGGMEQIKNTLSECGIEPLYIGGWSVGDKDFSSQLTRARASGADAIIGWGHTLEVGVMLRQMYQIGIKDSFKVIAGCASFSIGDTIKLTPEGVEGVYSVIDNIPQNPDPDLQKVRKTYQEKFGKDLNFNTLVGYDAIQLIVEALKKTEFFAKDISIEESREELREALSSIKDYKGSMATYSYDELNNGVHQALIVRVVDGEPAVIKFVNVAKNN